MQYLADSNIFTGKTRYNVIALDVIYFELLCFEFLTSHREVTNVSYKVSGAVGAMPSTETTQNKGNWAKTDRREKKETQKINAALSLLLKVWLQ